MDLIRVGVAESRVTAPPGLLCCYGLGSCLGLALYEAESRLAGLAHIMLPDSSASLKRGEDMPGRFADTALPALLEEMLEKGARRSGIFARLVGGANMFLFPGRPGPAAPTIGERNLKAALESLAREEVPLRSQDTGGNYGRSVEFNPENGAILVRTAQFGARWL